MMHYQAILHEYIISIRYPSGECASCSFCIPLCSLSLIFLYFFPYRLSSHHLISLVLALEINLTHQTPSCYILLCKLLCLLPSIHQIHWFLVLLRRENLSLLKNAYKAYRVKFAKGQTYSSGWNLCQQNICLHYAPAVRLQLKKDGWALRPPKNSLCSIEILAPGFRS